MHGTTPNGSAAGRAIAGEQRLRAPLDPAVRAALVGALSAVYGVPVHRLAGESVDGVLASLWVALCGD